jgi:integrase/recombinase XerD
MATDFAVCLQRFLTSHLAGLRGCSPNTIASYRDTFKLLIAFFGDIRSIPPDRLTLDHIDAAAITGFLNWLETERHNSISTRSQRLAGLSSFFRWLQSQDPARMAGCQDILAVPAKKTAQPGVNHLTVEQARRLLAAPDRSTRQGRRDATLLATLYDTAARASELAGLTVGDIRVQPPPLAVLARQRPQDPPRPARRQHRRAAERLPSRAWPQPAWPRPPPAVRQPAREQAKPRRDRLDHRQVPGQAGDPALAGAALSPHVLRHSRAMHLYDAGVPLPYIRDLLGHAELATTDIYARASTEAKRKALEAAYTDVVVTDDLPEWNQDAGLLNWLASL